MISVVILGSGNVGSHLIKSFLKAKNVKLKQVYSRNAEALKKFENKVATTCEIDKLESADVYILAISDRSIGKVSQYLNLHNQLVVHTSGTMALDALSSIHRRGVFYPLQTFTNNKPVSVKNIPICIEFENEQDKEQLEKLASAISNQVCVLDSMQRRKLHLAAVFVNNFTNHLYFQGEEICKKHNLPFGLLLPLIEETAAKIKKMGTKNAQTGPAKRGDFTTIDLHEKELEGIQLDIYQLFTKSIQQTYE